VDLYLTDRPEANEFLKQSAFALILGMLLDQQIPMEKAFASPHELARRMREQHDMELNPCNLASLPEEEAVALFSAKPALHRFPAAMAKKSQTLASIICSSYDGKAENIWLDAHDGKELVRRLHEIPGFGIEKAKIFAALIAKRLGVELEGWQQATDPFGEDGVYRSVADSDSKESLIKIREYKASVKKAKASGK
jgi:uncharacterized HhH-GPD family protein